MEKPNEGNCDNAGSVVKIFELLTKVISKEVTSPYGKVNLIGTLIVALIIVLQLVSSAFEKFATIIANAIRGFATASNDTNIILELLILAGTFFICLFFMYLTMPAEKKAKVIQDNPNDEIDKT